jgi:hypothetical protein
VTNYTDVPQINALYQEQQQVQTAIGHIDNGGMLTAFTIAPPPPPPYDPMNPTPPPMMQMDVRIINIGTVAPETMAALRAQLVERDGEITQNLTDLGVGPQPAPITDPPSNTVAPVVTQVDPNLVCDTGTWDGEPSSYSYQWVKDGTPIVGPTSSTYPIAFADVGATIACIVTATNALGSTEGPTSNGVVVVAPA